MKWWTVHSSEITSVFSDQKSLCGSRFLSQILNDKYGFCLFIQLRNTYLMCSILSSVVKIQKWFSQEYTCIAAAAKSLQSSPTLCDPIDSSPPGSPVPGILQARTLEWVAISFSNAWKWKVKVKSLSCVRLFATPWTAAHQAPLSMRFSRQEYWSGVSSPSSILVWGPNFWSGSAPRSYIVLCPTLWNIAKLTKDSWLNGLSSISARFQYKQKERVSTWSKFFFFFFI